jgi:alkanesulfonate monooxygenase SsuD/methylene tetrahydromethanopterin reductase-like flavin-dependent oxidoreductase (luciferase family)
MERAHLGQPIRYSGQYYNVDIKGWQRPYQPVRERLPIYLAGVREGMIRTAGEVADGLLGHPIYSLPWIRKLVLPSLERGLNSSGRQRRQFHVCLSVCCAIAPDVRQAQRAAAATIAFYATVNTYETLFQTHGFQREVQIIQQALLDNDTTAMVDAVTEEMVDVFSLAGTAADVRRKLEAYADLADSLCLTPPDQLIPLEESEVYRQAILTTFGR